MKIIGEKLSNQEMLATKGGEATCQCQDSDTGELLGFQFYIPEGEWYEQLEAASNMCVNILELGNGQVSCTGLNT